MELYPHQSIFLKKNPDKYLLAWEMRLGKTLASILWAKKKDGQTLIVCPKFLVTQWQEECTQNDLSAIIVGKEQFRIHHRALPPVKNIIADECHTFATPTSQLSKAFQWFLAKHIPPHLLLLSGTPLTSSPWCVYSYGIYLGKWGKEKWRVFRNTFFREQYFGRRSVFVPKEDEKTKQKLLSILRTFGETLSVEDVFDLPERLTVPIFFKETGEQKKLKALNRLQNILI